MKRRLQMMSAEKNPASYLESVLASAQIQLLQVEEAKPALAPARPVVVVHAGAEDAPGKERKRDLEAVKATATAAYELLLRKERGLTVVEYAVRQLETYYRRECERKAECGCKEVELEADAGIIEENNFKSGFVGGIQNYKHPITLAKYVLEKTDHMIIVGKGAEQLSAKVDDDDDDSCVVSEEMSKISIASDDQSQELSENEKSKEGSVSAENIQECKAKEITYKLRKFGAATYDNDRKLSCGATVFRGADFGRLSATGTVVGCGLSADERAGCVSVSGLEDTRIYARAPGHGVIEALLGSEDNDKAKRAALRAEIDDLGDGMAGAVSIDVYGIPRVFYNCASFPWAYCCKGMLFYGCEANDFHCEKLELEPAGSTGCHSVEETSAQVC